MGYSTLRSAVTGTSSCSLGFACLFILNTAGLNKIGKCLFLQSAVLKASLPYCCSSCTPHHASQLVKSGSGKISVETSACLLMKSILGLYQNIRQFQQKKPKSCLFCFKKGVLYDLERNHSVFSWLGLVSWSLLFKKKVLYLHKFQKINTRTVNSFSLPEVSLVHIDWWKKSKLDMVTIRKKEISLDFQVSCYFSCYFKRGNPGEDKKNWLEKWPDMKSSEAWICRSFTLLFIRDTKNNRKPEYEAEENAAIEELQIQQNQNKLQEKNTFGDWEKHWASQEAACWSSGCGQIRLDRSQADIGFVKKTRLKGKVIFRYMHKKRD